MTEAQMIAQLHPDLVRVIVEARRMGALFRVIKATRGRREQAQAKANGASRASFGQSPHNFIIALAFDAIPLDANKQFKNEYWKNNKMFVELAKVIKKAANNIGVKITWGGDFKSLYDSPHYELTNWKTIKGALAE